MRIAVTIRDNGRKGLDECRDVILQPATQHPVTQEQDLLRDIQSRVRMGVER